jgi:hypothetical protein
MHATPDNCKRFLDAQKIAGRRWFPRRKDRGSVAGGFSRAGAKMVGWGFTLRKTIANRKSQDGCFATTRFLVVVVG